MNKYTAIGLIVGALDGESIIVLSPTQYAARDAFREVQHVVPEGEHVTTRSANGDERLTFGGGGSIRFMTSRALPRHVADVVYIEFGDNLAFDELTLVHLATRSNGVIVRP